MWSLMNSQAGINSLMRTLTIIGRQKTKEVAMTIITKEQIEQLRAPFALADHSIREGNTIANGQSSMWFVYLDRMAVIDRLDELFPGEWEYEMKSIEKREGHYSCVGRLIIRGMVREFNGTQKISDRSPENDEKGVGTDTFRRAASMWGIGRYLYDGPMIITDNPKKDFGLRKAMETQAKNKFADWYRRKFGSEQVSHQKPDKSNNEQPAPPPEPEHNVNTSFNEVQFLDRFMKRFPGSHHMPVLKETGVKTLNELGNVKQAGRTLSEWCYEHERPVLVEFQRYVVRGEQKYLEFTANPTPALSHGLIRAYGRSSTFRERLSEDCPGMYESLQLDRRSYDEATETTEWQPMAYPLVMYYTAAPGGYYTFEKAELPEEEK
jgi:hypothetical protein